MFLSFLFFLVIPLLGFSFLFQVSAIGYLKKEIHNNSRENLRLILANADQAMKRAWASAVSISMDPRVDFLLRKQTEQPLGDADYASAALDTLGVMRAYTAMDDLMHSMYIYNEESGMIFTNEGESVPAEAFLDSGWLAYHRSDLNRIVYIPSRKPVDPEYLGREGSPLDIDRDIHSRVITILFPLNFHPYKSLRGSVVINLREAELFSPALRADYFLFDHSGRLLSRASQEERRGAEALIRQALRRGRAEGSVDGRFQGRKVLYTMVQSAGNGLIITKRTFLSQYYGWVRKLQFLNLLSLLVLLFAGVLSAWRFARRIYRPIAGVLVGLEGAAGPGNSPRGGDELQQISQAVDSILRQDRNIQKILDDNRNGVTETMVMNLIRGKVDGAEVVFPSSEGDFFCLVLTLHGRKSFQERYSYAEQYAVRSLILRQALELINRRWGGAGVLLGDEKIAVIAQVPGRRAKKQLLRELQQAYAAEESYAVVLAAGGLSPRPESLRGSFLEALEALSYRISFRREDSIDYSDLDKTARGPVSLEGPSARLLGCLKEGRKGDIPRAVEELTVELFSQGLLNYEEVLESLSPLISGSRALLRSRGSLEPELLLPYRSLYHMIADRETRDDLREELKAYYLRAASLLEERSKRAPSARLLALIERRSRDPDLNLTLLADCMGLSYSHTRRLIRSIAGVSFTDYLNRIRIRKAAVLLAETDRPQRAVAAEVGYHNTQSFARYFKKYEGISPGEYRRLKKDSGS